MLRFLTLAAIAAALPMLAQARTLEVGKGKEFSMPSAAIAVAHDGDHVEIQPGEYFDCAVVLPNDLVIEGVGDPASVVMTDKTCQGKALLVTDGQRITIRNMTLTRARVPDNNGAAIRAEGHDLTLEHLRIINNQDGILSGTAGGTITIRDSLFDHNGVCRGACSHGVYVGNLDLLKIERTTFTNTMEGHHIKSRALRTEVTGCSIQDGPDGTASYEIEIPNGGSLVARNNTIEKGPKAQNHATIVIGAEGVTQPTKELTIENNTFRNDGDFQALFVRNITATPAILKGNHFTGSVTPLEGDGQVTP